MIIIVAAIAGPLWISTEEKIPWLAVNTSFYRSNYTVSYIIKSSNASLWILCTRQGLLFCLLGSEFHCFFFLCTKAGNHFAMMKKKYFPRDLLLKMLGMVRVSRHLKQFQIVLRAILLSDSLTTLLKLKNIFSYHCFRPFSLHLVTPRLGRNQATRPE